MNFSQISFHFRRLLPTISNSIRARPPFSYSSLYYLSNPTACGCKFSSFANTSIPPQDISSDTSTLIDEFARVLQHNDIYSVTSHPVSAECHQRLLDLDDQQFLALLNHFNSFYQQKGGIYREIFSKRNPLNWLLSSLDSECFKRFGLRDYTEAFTILESNPVLCSAYESKMVNHVLRKCGKTPSSAPKPLLTRYVTLMNHHRLWRQPFNFYWLEYCLQHRFDELEIPELCLFLEAYVVTSYRFVSHDELLVNIFDRFIDELENIDKKHLLTFLLFANRQVYLYQYSTFTPRAIKLLSFLDSNFEAYPLIFHIYAASFSTKFLIYRPSYLQKICEAVIKIPASSFDDLRSTEISWIKFLPTSVVKIKRNHSIPETDQPLDSYFPLLAFQMKKLTHVVAFFNCTRLAPQLKSFLENDTMSRYLLDTNPAIYTHSITYLAYLGHFSHLIDTFLSEEFLLKVFKKLTPYRVHRHILRLDAAMEIECPDYAGHRLEPKFRSKMISFGLYHNPKRIVFYDKETLKVRYKTFPSEQALREHVLYKYTMDEAATLLAELLGDDYTLMYRPLPHLTSKNLIWCTDAAGQPQKLPVEVKNGSIINFDAIDHYKQRWYVLVCSSRNAHDEEGPGAMVVGKEVPKVRQLRLLGFRVVEVVFEEWEMLTRDQKLNVLKLKLGLPVN